MMLPPGISLLTRRAFVSATILFTVPAALERGEAQRRAWTVESGDVRVTCPLTIGGSFELRTKSLAGTLALGATPSAPLDGRLAVDLRTLDSGIELRNAHLRDTYLEVARGDGFDTAVLADIRIEGGDPAAFQGRTNLTGTLRLHGTSRQVAGRATIARTRSWVRVDAAFPVSLRDYGIADPRYLSVGVRNEVQVRVNFTAAAADEGFLR